MEFEREIDSIRDTLSREAQAIAFIRETLDQKQAEAVLHAITACRGKVIASGCGTSAMAARKLAHTLCCIDCPALFLVPSDAAHGGLGVIQKEDVVILITKGGETAELEAMTGCVREKGALLILVTEKESSALALQADIVLKVRVEREPDDYNMLATASTLGVIAVFDALAIAVTRFRGYSKEAFARIHPGGNVGRRLNNKEA